MRRYLIAAILWCLSISAFAQTDGRNSRFDDALLDNLVGPSWDAPGQVRGLAAHDTVSAAWVLNHQFVQVKLEDTAIPKQYEAWLFIGYDFRSERYVVHWIDVFGGRFSETLGYGTRTNDSLRFIFEYGDGPFRNALTWNATSKTWHWLIESKDDAGKWKTFADYNLSRTPPKP